MFYFLRYECPAGCLDSKAKVIGSVHYEMVNILKLDSAPVECLMKYFSVGMLVKNILKWILKKSIFTKNESLYQMFKITSDSLKFASAVLRILSKYTSYTCTEVEFLCLHICI